MSRGYKVQGQQSVANPTDTALTIGSGTDQRPTIHEAYCSSIATPADNALQWILQRCTALGTGTGVTPTATDPDDPPSLATCAENHTAGPTYTSGHTLFDGGVNQRGGLPLVFDRFPLRLPALANNGIGFQPVHSSFTGDVIVDVLFED